MFILLPSDTNKNLHRLVELCINYQVLPRSFWATNDWAGEKCGWWSACKSQASCISSSTGWFSHSRNSMLLKLSTYNNIFCSQDGLETWYYIISNFWELLQYLPSKQIRRKEHPLHLTSWSLSNRCLKTPKTGRVKKHKVFCGSQCAMFILV